MTLQTKAVLGFVCVSVAACVYIQSTSMPILESLHEAKFEERGEFLKREWMMTRDPKRIGYPMEYD